MIHVRRGAGAIASGLCERVLITHGESGSLYRPSACAPSLRSPRQRRSMELFSTRSFEVENEVENPCRQPQKVAVYLGYFMMREMDSNPRSPAEFGNFDVSRKGPGRPKDAVPR